MAYFPQIGANGMMVQLPFVQTFSHLTSVSELQSGPRQSYAWRPNPLMAWDLTYPALTPAEYNTLMAFFVSQQGRYGEFTFLDPGGNLVAASENLSDASWTATGLSLTATQPDPFGSMLATACAAAGEGKLSAPAVAVGAVNGFWLCGSVWVQSASAVAVTIALVDSASAVQCSTTQTLVPGVWARIATSAVIASAYPISITISWSAATVVVFGAQVVPTGGPGAYQRTPGNYGVHPNVRFDTDVLEPQYVSPGQVAVKLRLVEYAPSVAQQTRFGLDSLCGVWTDSSGNVVQAVWIGNGPALLTCPVGACQLQLGVNDDHYADNSGSWVIAVNDIDYTVAGNAQPWLHAGGINSALPFGLDDGAPPAIIAGFTAGTTAAVQYVSGAVCPGVGFTLYYDANGDVSYFAGLTGSTGKYFPAKYMV